MTDHKAFTHLVVTRMNCAYPSNDPSYPKRLYVRVKELRANQDWLKSRIDYLEAITKPAIDIQINQDFRWVILAHSDSPDWFKVALNEYASVAEIILTHKSPRHWLPGYIKKTVDTEWTITTTLDSDDSVSSLFTAAIQNNFEAKKEYINPLKGFAYSTKTKRYYGRESTASPYISFAEKTAEARGVYCVVHSAAVNVAPVKQIGEKYPLWIQVCHGENILNKARVKKKHRGREYCEIKKLGFLKIPDLEFWSS